MLRVLFLFNLFLTMIKYSIIICSYNRFKLLTETIDSVLSVLQNRDDYEILIIDNKSTDATPSLVEKYRSIKTVNYFLESQQGLSYARNRGMKEAKGEILLYLDDDIELVDNYFSVCDEIFLDKSISITGGKVLPYKVNIPEWLPKKYYYLVSVFDLGDSVKHVRYIMGGNFAIRKIDSSRIGLYNTALGRNGKILAGGEEIDYQNRATAIGYNIYYHPKQNILHKINEKLNKKYVLDYSLEQGKSQRIIDFSFSKTIFITTILKSFFVIVSYHFLIVFISNPKVNTYLKIINQYSKGYLNLSK